MLNKLRFLYSAAQNIYGGVEKNDSAINIIYHENVFRMRLNCTKFKTLFSAIYIIYTSLIRSILTTVDSTFFCKDSAHNKKHHTKLCNVEFLRTELTSCCSHK